MMHKLFTEGTKGEKQKMTEIGLVPMSWEVVEFESMVKYTSKPRNLKIEYPVDFIPMDIISEQEIYVTNTEKRDRISSGSYAENGDLLLAKITPSFENGKQCIVKIEKDYTYATTEVIAFKERISISSKLYLFYWLKKEDVRKDLAGKMEGSTGRQRLNKTVLNKKNIPKPKIAEQKVIGKILFDIDFKVNQYSKRRQKLEELFKTLMMQMITGNFEVENLDLKKNV